MALRRRDYLIVSCEHGGNRVPVRYRGILSNAALATHRGYDPGALAMARALAASTGAPLFYSTVSRLLVELHLSSHSFTPRLAGVERDADVGLLFDPRRAPEARFCRLWRTALRRHAPRLRVRYNYPYRGAADSLVASLREKLGARRYVGIQIEISQKFPRGDERRWRALRTLLVASLDEALLELHLT